jgi:glycosyltransferase involved in cell wall biosynthesis
MTIDRIAFFSYNQYPSALEQYRIYSPLKQAGIEIVPGIRGNQLALEAIDQAPLVLFQRDFSHHFQDYQQVLERAHAQGKPVVLDLDDHLLALPEDHPDRLSGVFADRLPALLHSILNSDAITVTTPVLRQALLPYNERIYVLPNYFDAELWQFREPKPAEKGAPVRILFMGTPTHRPDLELIAEPLAHIAQKYAHQVAFIFFGAQPPSSLQGAGNVTYLPLHTYTYRDFLQEYQQLEAEIAIAPLQDNLFNRSKSAIKYFEYAALGLPGVFSALPPYTEVVQDGQDGFLAANPEEWEHKLELLIESPELRLQLAHQAQEQVQQNWFIQNHAREWQDVYDQCLEKEIIEPTIDQFLNNTIASISTQLQEYHQKVNLDVLQDKTSQIQRLTDVIETVQQQLAETMAQNEGLQLEIVDYTTSTSWKITRPLRRLSRLLRRK